MVAVKPAELRNNQKEYFDQVYNGETIVVSRPRSCNVVIISEEKYNEIQEQLRIASYYVKLEEAHIESRQKSLIEIEDDIKELERRRMKRRAFDEKIKNKPKSGVEKDRVIEEYLGEMRDDRF